MITTLAQAETHYGITHHDYLDKTADIPVVTGVAAQGDIIIVRRDQAKTATTPIPATGYPVVRGENGGNTHAVFGPGCYTPATRNDDLSNPSNLDLGTLTVPAGNQVLLSHPEHGGLIITGGTYLIRRQRQQADIIRFVED
jgi:hypothetical protein